MFKSVWERASRLLYIGVAVIALLISPLITLVVSTSQSLFSLAEQLLSADWVKSVAEIAQAMQKHGIKPSLRRPENPDTRSDTARDHVSMLRTIGGGSGDSAVFHRFSLA